MEYGVHASNGLIFGSWFLVFPFPRALASCLALRNCILSADWVCRFDIPTIVLCVTCIICAGRLPYDTIQEYQIRNSLASLLRRLLETISLSESGQCVYLPGISLSCSRSLDPFPGLYHHVARPWKETCSQNEDPSSVMDSTVMVFGCGHVLSRECPLPHCLPRGFRMVAVRRGSCHTVPVREKIVLVAQDVCTD